ncbi:MAG: oxidoreductase [Deltaproteobacteria bacterium HGW-Deltaproteobacteria-21]|jgi:predicted dehydrogenase|nr:MAG: oxidoreductase [Deltaproteobacteria bacterium HGW-Deltaproteobacteria-21]PKN67051.1 MAG: oxidoreductase [Deltaproteobacteria bacterium HGW-Deltaproteobacteria-15]
MIKAGLIGYGYWGPNIARNFQSSPDIELTAICDFSPDRLRAARRLYPYIKAVDRPGELFKDTDIDAIAIATPVSTHYALAREAILSGKHVWLEKPMTESVEQGEELIELSEKHGKILLVDHTFIYTGAVQKIKELVDQGEVGDLVYYDSTRVNLGLFQQDVDVIWDLAPHDISIMNYVMPLKNLMVSATGCHYYGDKLIAKALLTIYMEQNKTGHINVSWVSPVKIRQTLIGGTSKMILYDDNQPSEKIRVYDKGVDLYETKEALYHLKVQYRVGDMYAPKLKDLEALSFETRHFVECMNNGKKPLTDCVAGLEVVKILSASRKSLQGNGIPVELK